MPSYDYECAVCGKISEEFHAMSAEPMIDCSVCSVPMIKLIGPGAAIIIKGTENPCYGNRGSKAKKKSPSKTKTEKPFWRDDDGPINKDILKNPEKYIREGEV